MSSKQQEQKENFIANFLLTLINFYGIYDGDLAYATICEEVAEIKEKTFVKICRELEEKTNMVHLINYEEKQYCIGSELVSGFLFNEGTLNNEFYNFIKGRRKEYEQYDFLKLSNNNFFKYAKFDYYEKTEDIKNFRNFLKNEYKADMKNIDIELNNLFMHNKMFGYSFIAIGAYITNLSISGKIKLNDEDYKIVCQYLIKIFEHQRSWIYYGNRKEELPNFISFDHPLIFDILLDIHNQYLSFEKYNERIHKFYYGNDIEHLEDLLYQVAIAIQDIHKFKEIKEEESNSNYVS